MTDEQQRMLSDLHSALLDVPPGSPKDAKPLIEEIRIVVRAYQRGSWFARFVVWSLPAVAGIGIAMEKIRGWFQ